MQEPWVCMEDIATHLNVTPETIRNWIKNARAAGVAERSVVVTPV